MTEHNIIIKITATPDVTRKQLITTLKEHLDNFGWGMFWNKNFTKSSVEKVYIDNKLFQNLED